jgi:phenylalanyl-tRNA synthetase beta chain
MNISRRWLEAFLRQPIDAKDAAVRLAMLGAPVDAIEATHAGLRPFVIARVLEVGPHPDPKATKVRLTKVDDGSGAHRTVVCGAPNVTAGHVYPFARLGTMMPAGFTIESRAIRGVISEGMLCSARELGLGQDADGLMTLDTEAPVGTPLLDVLGLGDETLVVDVTPNRADLLGHKGVARELASSYGVPFRLPSIPGSLGADLPPATRAASEAQAGPVTVRIDDPAVCGRFLGVTLRGVRVGASPAWLRERLEAAGVRPISTIVDATNYVMLELNQPMHAYDVATLKGGLVAARSAQAGETIVTLDGKTRAVPAGAPIIADAEGLIGIAGVMGGQRTEVGDATTDVFLECAWFDPSRVRAARRAVGLSTEASYRFERGVDKWNALEALRRCVEVVTAIAGGELAGTPVDIVPVLTHPPRIFLRLARITRILGVELPLREVERCLVAIGATVVSKPDDGRIAVDVPGWRHDLKEEIDLIEEVARVHGYDAMPSELRPFRVGSREDSPSFVAAGRVRAGLAALGLREAMTLALGRPDGATAVALQNPLSADHAALRTRLLPGLVSQAELNWSGMVRDIRLFEIGTVFSARPAGERPHEEMHVAAVISGAMAPAHWSAQPADTDIWDLKGLLDAAVALALPGGSVQVDESGLVAVDAAGCIVGRAAQLVADAPKWAAPLFGFELQIVVGAAPAIRFVPLPVTPAAERDFALIVPDAIAASAVLDAIRTTPDMPLEDVQVLSEYRGAGVPEGHRSLAVRCVFRAADRTLVEADLDAAERGLLSKLQHLLGVTRRSA